MKLIDGKGKIFGIINIIDLLVILLIVAVVARFAMKTNTTPLTAETKNIEVVLHVKEVRDATANVIKEGDIVRDKTNVVLASDKRAVRPAETLVDSRRRVVTTRTCAKEMDITIMGTGTAGENAIVGGTVK